MLSGASRTILHRVLTCAVLPKSIKRRLHRVVWSLSCLKPYKKLSRASWTTLHKVFSCAMFPQVKQFCTGFFLMHCCLEPLRYYCMRFWPVQNCLKSIETKLQRILSYAMLSGASLTTCHRVFTCFRSSIKAKLHRIFSYTKLCGASWATLHRVFSCTMLSQEYKKILHRIFSYALLLGASHI